MDDFADEHTSECGALNCLNSWILLPIHNPPSCRKCKEEFCSDRCSDQHMDQFWSTALGEMTCGDE